MAEPDRLRCADALPHLLVGRDPRAGWVVIETHGRCGGLFCDETAALRFARQASGGHEDMIEFTERPLDPFFSRAVP